MSIENYHQLEKDRIQKLNNLKKIGIDCYSETFYKKHSIQDVLDFFPEDKSNFIAESQESINIATAGRVISVRSMGKAIFFNVQDFSNKIQVYANNKILSKKDYTILQQLDIGDIVGIEGAIFLTKKNECSIRAQKMVLLSKNITPMPIVKESKEKIYDSFSDQELRYRKRYIDLSVNNSTKNDFITRTRIIQQIRNFLIENNFYEVETPMLQKTASGASAKPFETFHNTLKMKLYLRIAPELYLKRLLVGGFEKVFEINRNFRNEGISPNHNPEFTMLELYQTYADYQTMMDIIQNMLLFLLKKLNNDSTILEYGDHKIDFQKKNWKKIRYLDSISNALKKDVQKFILDHENSFECLKKILLESKIKHDDCKTIWELLDRVFSEKIEPTLIQPTFITDFPKEISPLSKSKKNETNITERFELFIAKKEIANAFSELNNPFEQEKRFLEQMKQQKQGAKEYTAIDYDYIEALKTGMPPAGGMGVGIDRLVMIFTNKKSIKDVIFFPLLKNN